MNVIIGLVGLGLMVFIHELGHFVAAKMNGVEVEVFSLGWGPRLAGFRHRGTSYQISWFPIGGYCKMKGELVPGLAGGGAETGTVAAPEKGSFLASASWRRVIIYVFGPLFNLLFALLVTAVIWWAGFTTFSADNRVILRSPAPAQSPISAYPAAASGLLTGDRIVAIDGSPIRNFYDISLAVSYASGKALRMTVERLEGSAPRTLSLTVTPALDKNTGPGYIGIAAWFDPVVDSVQPGGPAAIAGLQKGDRIVAFDGKEIRNANDLDLALQAKSVRAEIKVERSGATLVAPIVPAVDASGAPLLGIGIVGNVYRSPRVGPVGALARSAQETWETARITVKGFGLLFKGINLRNAVAGPIGITSAIGTATTSGFQRGFGVGVVTFFQLLSLLSVVLFLMNLLPIPAMDGGQIVLLAAEIARRKPAKPSIVWRLQLIGFTLMISLLILVSLNDILRSAGR